MKPLTIALVEDDPTITEVIAELLEQEGYIVHCYARSAHLLCRMSPSRPDIVLLDGAHPVCYDGWEAAARLHDSGCQVVMFTAHQGAINEMGMTPRAAVFAGVIAKPCDIDDVLLTISRICAQSPHLHDAGGGSVKRCLAPVLHHER